MHPIDDQTYKVLVQLLKGTFKKPVRERNSFDKKAIVLFWRNKANLSLETDSINDILLFKGKAILRKEDISTQVETKLKQSKGSGARSITYSLKEKFPCISEEVVKTCLQKNKEHGHIHAQFNNKPPLKCITAEKIFERVQIDLLKMDTVTVDGDTYKYILSAVDSFSRFVFLRPLRSKRATEVAKALQSIFEEHGYPDILQCDNGKEFLGPVKHLLVKNDVRIIKGRPYHPQSQGKVERQNRVIRQKIRFEMQRRRKHGINWVERLMSVESSMNSQPKEVLAYKSPFQIYFGRDANSSIDAMREMAASASRRCAQRNISRHFKTNSCSIYKPGEKVLLQYPFRKARVPSKRYVLKAKILKRGKNFARYYVSFTSPDNKALCKWVNVENITSLTRQGEKIRRAVSNRFFDQKERQRKHKLKYYITVDTENVTRKSTRYIHSKLINQEEKEYFCGNKNVVIKLNPRGVGDCQFKAVADQLQSLGLQSGSDGLRLTAVKHLEKHRSHYIDFIQGAFQVYLDEMKKENTFGDNLTLQALAREYNCQFLVMNAQGEGYHRVISNTNIYDTDMVLLTLGYFPEDNGEHYVSIIVEDEYKENVLQTINSSYQAGLDTEEQSDSSSDTSMEICMTSQEYIKTIPFSDIDISGMDQMLQHERNNDFDNASVETQTEQCYPFLPQDIMEKIIKESIKLNPSMIFTHLKVNKLFRSVAQAFGYPQIYLKPCQKYRIGSQISILKLIRMYGRHSGVMVYLRELLKDAKKPIHTTCLKLKKEDHDWFSIVALFRHKN